jgi:hypothetical protein
MIPKSLRTIPDLTPIPEPMKLKGKRFYRGDVLVAEIFGHRSTYPTVYCDFWVKAGDRTHRGGWAYFRDVVKWVRWAAENGEL